MHVQITLFFIFLSAALFSDLKISYYFYFIKNNNKTITIYFLEQYKT